MSISTIFKHIFISFVFLFPAAEMTAMDWSKKSKKQLFKAEMQKQYASFFGTPGDCVLQDTNQTQNQTQKETNSTQGESNAELSDTLFIDEKDNIKRNQHLKNKEPLISSQVKIVESLKELSIEEKKLIEDGTLTVIDAIVVNRMPVEFKGINYFGIEEDFVQQYKFFNNTYIVIGKSKTTCLVLKNCEKYATGTCDSQTGEWKFQYFEKEEIK